MPYLVLDTDAASHLQRGTLPDGLMRQLLGEVLAVTFVTVGEFYKGAYLRGWGLPRLNRMEGWLRSVVVIPYDAAVAQEWGKVSAEGQAAGRIIAANDAWIAACCRVHSLRLMTLNLRHFEYVEGLTLVEEPSTT